MALSCLWLATGCRVLQQPVSMRTMTARELASDGLDALQQDEPDRAQSLLSRACKMCPEDKRIRIHLARTLRQRGDYSEATRELEKALGKSKDDPALLVELSELQLDQGNAQAALELANQACELAPKLPDTWAMVGRAQFAQGRNKDAAGSFHKALILNPDAEAVRLALVDCYIQNGEPHRALSNLELLAAKYPRQRVPEEVSMRLAGVYQRLGLQRDADSSRVLR